MIGPGTGVRVYVASGVTDMRKGIKGLAAAAEQVLRQNPCSGAVFAFRGKKGDRVKLLYWDQQGFCLYYKVFVCITRSCNAVASPGHRRRTGLFG